MYEHEQFDLANPFSAHGFVPPFHELVALPAYVTSDPGAGVFSIMTVLRAVFHESQRTATLFQPRIWAPAWTESDLFDYLTAPLAKGFWPFQPAEPEALRVRSFLDPEADLDPVWLKAHGYDILHLTGAVLSPQPGRFLLDDGNKMWLPEEFAGRLVACHTRLFILQCARPEGWEGARAFVREVVRAGAAAALAIAGSREALRDYCVALYGAIAHNRPLSEAAASYRDWPALSACLATRAGTEDLLRLDQWAQALPEQLAYWETAVARQAEDSLLLREELMGKIRDYGHPSQFEKIVRLEEAERAETMRVVETLSEQRRRLKALPPQPWHHEREGTLVVSGATSAFRDLRPQIVELNRKLVAPLGIAPGSEKTESGPEWMKAVEEELRAAPRVLNAGFRFAGQAEMIGPAQTLVSGGEYELLVDIGPRWDKLTSLVTGTAEFPAKALPSGEAGHLIDVVFLSEEFSPSLVGGRIFLPVDSGRSGPWNAKDKEKRSPVEPGPLILRVRAPESAQDSAVTRVAHGRLGLYFENNLLQSAQVRMNISRDGRASAPEPNAVAVDFVLSGGFQEIGTRFAKRKVRFSADDRWEETEGKGHPLAMNITLNDDGSGSHRILVKSQKTEHSDMPEISAWMNYDPGGGEKLLDLSRADLADCFFEKDSQTGMVRESAREDNRSALDPDNGQKKVQFQWDLVRLAERGEKLFNAVFSNLRLNGNSATGAAQARLFQAALSRPRVIQVARTGPAGYTLPWALLYEIPLSQDRSQNRFCESLKEWDATGGRHGRSATCPYSDDPDHDQNVYCPWGFWGLKHIVEQPLSPVPPEQGNGTANPRLREIPETFGAPGVIPLGLCSTTALNDMNSVNAHLQALAAAKSFQAHFPPARGLDDAKTELLNAALVYFLCHGKLDAAACEPYLGIGPDDADPQHRIYPGTIESWARGRSWEPWDRRRPLVFINGCHTCDLRPGQMLEFVSAFGFAGASGVLGTEIGVQLGLAIEVAGTILSRAAEGIPIGEIFRDMRWDLANKGNLLGLAYTPYCLANLTHAGA